MRAYFKPSKVHAICLYLDPDEAARLLEEMDSVDLDSTPTVLRARTMLNRAFAELEESA
ncbi:hypothetical protein ACFCZT_24705 [Streptomyces sp. NPDC056230]|uniref:hypothetical protein n=1 Tax=Streptomyces sp. NPDC056230 TaxID=3345754 RepID=UPI0035D74921